MPVTKSMWDELAEFETKSEKLKSQLTDIDAQLADAKPSALKGLQERRSNLVRGIEKHHDEMQAKGAEWAADVLGTRAADNLESGDGATGGSRRLGGIRRGVKAGSFAEAIVDTGFELKSRPSIEFSPYDALKAPTWPGVTDLSRRAPAIVQSGFDRRWLFPNLWTENAGEDTSIQDFKQTARSLTGTVKRALDATTDKATLDTTLTLATEALSQFAVVIEGIPNQILESVRTFAAFLESEAQFQVEKAIDDHVFAQIVAATPPFGQTGTTLIEKVRNGIGSMRATGANPTLLVVNPTDAAALDLATDAGGFIFPTASAGSASPLWGMKLIERIGAGTEAPYLIDPAMLGVLYLGRSRFEADPYTGFKKNLTNVRFELNGLMHIRNANGARRIAAS
jgi:hypothetical protein